MDTLSAVGGASLGAVASVGNFLDLPGSSIRDILAGQNPLDQWLTPLTDANRTTGRQLLEKYGMRANRETGMTGWLSDPGEGLRDLAGFGAEVLLDPFGPLTKGTKMATGAASLVDRAHPVVKGLAKGSVNLFDRLPGKVGQVTKQFVIDKSKDLGRGIKALFNAPSGGVTDVYAQGIKERATATAEAAKQLADTMTIDIVETANRSGFNLNRNNDLDMNDPANWLADDSPLLTKAREDQLTRFWEGTYDPANAGMKQGDLVTPQGSDAFKEVEWIDRSSTGTKVKLVNDDRIYNDFDFDPKKQWLSQAVEIPQEVQDVMLQMKGFRDTLKNEVHELGGNIGELMDPYIDFTHRRKGVDLARAEQIGGLAHHNWVRNKYASLASTLQATGGREMLYKAFKDGTPGVTDLYRDNNWQNIVRSVNQLATGVGKDSGPNFLPGYVGMRHVQEFAEALGKTPEDVFREMQALRPVNATDSRAFVSAPGVYSVTKQGSVIGSLAVDVVDGVARVNTAGLPDMSVLPDALHDVAWHLARDGAASKVQINVPSPTFTPGEAFNDSAYGLVQRVEVGGEIPAYHASGTKVPAFDDSKLGSNSAKAQGVYSADSQLGHQFVEDSSALVNYPNRSNLLGDVIHAVRVKAGKTAVIDIHDLRKKLPTNADVQQFKKYLSDNGFSSVRLVGGGAGKLTDNTLVALSGKAVTIDKYLNPEDAASYVPVSMSDSLKPLGYVPDGLNPDGTERLVRSVFNADDTYTAFDKFMPKDEFLARFNGYVAYLADQVKQGDAAGVQPGRGWWKSYTSITPKADGTERVLNLNPEDLKFVDKNNILDPNIRRLFTKINEYDAAIAHVQEGKELYIGVKHDRGKRSELLFLKPTQRHQVELQHKQLVSKLEKMLTDSPLTQAEAITDAVHGAITRNYSDKVDQWMPEFDKSGDIIATNAAGDSVRRAGLKEWHKAFDDLNDGMELVRPQSLHESLLRLDDDSLQALMFTPAQRQKIAGLREQIVDKADVIQDEAGRQAATIQQDMSIPLVDRHRGIAEDLAQNVERRFNNMYEGSSVSSNLEYLRKNVSFKSLLQEQRDFIGKAVVDARTNPEAFGTRSPRGNVDVEYDLANKRGMTFEQAIKDGFFGEGISDKRFIESVRQYLIKNKAMTATDKADEIVKQINEIKSLRLMADTWSQMKTFNEGMGMATMPELETPFRWAQNLMSATKAGQLSTSFATGVRDGMSSYFNGIVMGDMDPAAILRHGKAAISFTKGMAIDPGKGIADIEQYLAAKGLPSTAETRGQVFQNMWNAHHMHGSPNPDIITADAFRLAEADSSMALLRNRAGSQPGEALAGLKRTVQKPWQVFDPRVQGTWTTDELGRQVQRSEGKNPLVNMMNGFRGMIDTTIRTTFVLDRLKKTGSMAQALADADRILLNADPKNFTRFEHKFMKSVVPYYSFIRQSLPLFISEMMVNPGGKLGMTIRGTRLGQGGEKDYVPYQYLDSAAIPIGETDEGQLKYLTSLGLMHEDAVKYAGNALQGDLRGLMQHALSSSNPAMKWLIEYSTNTSLFSQGPMGGRRLDDLDPTMGRIAANLGLQSVDASGRPLPVGGAITESVAAMSPISRLLSTTKIATDKRLSAKDKVARLVTGFRVETVEKEQITRDLRDRLNAIQIKLGARPLTIVSGAEKLKQFALDNGDTETAAQLDQIEKALALQKKLDREAEKGTGDEPVKDSRKALIDRLRALR